MVRLLGFAPFREAPSRPGRERDPASDFGLLQGLGHARCVQSSTCNTASTRQSPGPIRDPYPLVGFRRPSNADVPVICTGPHPLARPVGQTFLSAVRSGVAGPSAF